MSRLPVWMFPFGGDFVFMPSRFLIVGWLPCYMFPRGTFFIGLRPYISANLSFLGSCVFAWGHVWCSEGASPAPSSLSSAPVHGYAFFLSQGIRLDGTKQVRFDELPFPLGFVSEGFRSHG
ncbi:hypothetical protein M514_17256, partial [Trichuris suis]